MNIEKYPKLAIAMNYIEDDLISEAIDYKPISHKKIIQIWKLIAAIAVCIILALGIGQILSYNNILPTHETSPVREVGDAPAHFYFENNYYHYSGKYVYELPEDFEFVSKVKNVGNSFTGVDFEGNVDGYIYINKSDKSIAYFRWEVWDEEIDGKEKILVFDRTE